MLKHLPRIRSRLLTSPMSHLGKLLLPNILFEEQRRDDNEDEDYQLKTLSLFCVKKPRS